MARHVEEEENHWPGFVDALSTIVLVVTFLLIILGVAIFAISTKVTKAVSQSQAEAQQASQVQAQMEASLEQKAAEARQAEQKAIDAAAALSAAQAAEKAAKDQLASIPPVDPTVDQRLKQAQQTIADQAQQIEQQKQATAELVNKVVAQDQSAANAPTQDTAITADNQLRIVSRKAIDPAEINVAAQEDSTTQKAVSVESAAAVLTVRFEDRAVQLDDNGQAKTLAFVKTNAATLSGKKMTLWSFYDANALGITQAKRSAYFRVLALRNAMLDAGLDRQNIDVNVRPADKPTDVDTVQAFVQ